MRKVDISECNKTDKQTLVASELQVALLRSGWGGTMGGQVAYPPPHWSLIPNVSIQLQLRDEFNIILYDLVQLASDPVQSIRDGIESFIQRCAFVLCQKCGQQLFPKLFCYHCTPLRKALLFQSGWIFVKVRRVRFWVGKKVLRKVLKKVQKKCWLEIFTQTPSVASVTDMRYGSTAV